MLVVATQLTTLKEIIMKYHFIKLHHLTILTDYSVVYVREFNFTPVYILITILLLHEP